MWGKLEQSLDNLLLTAINIANREGSAHEMQIALGRKLKLLREIYSSCTALVPLSALATAVADKVKACGEDRHLVIHANWVGFDDGPPPTMVMRHLKHKAGNITISRVAPQIAHLAQMAGNFHAARSEVLSLLLATNERIDPEIWQRAQEQARKGGGRFPPIEL